MHHECFPADDELFKLVERCNAQPGDPCALSGVREGQAEVMIRRRRRQTTNPGLEGNVMAERHSSEAPFLDHAPRAGANCYSKLERRPGRVGGAED